MMIAFTGLFSVLLSSLFSLFKFLLRGVVFKFILFWGLYFVVHEFIAVVSSWLPQSSDLEQLFSMLPDSAWYFLDLFQVSYGLSVVISALLVRFFIRRVPFVG
ncbi:DUF2523 domain-containing protein [Escherichia coli]|uniref:DUF2523 family protein n=1 Tax=Escherichia TaxID=561 RepID=UPI0019AA4106|nr:MULTISPECIES: DUF2523 family protein [Escherichia]MEB5809943.1 DUF2523 domain-containing protein [Escherichia coli]MEB5809953.1 DUF2523 domain-containing protein [Escherichia coli]CAD5751119.1 phage-related membrane protein [Escherichia coli]CAD5751201.1 phage-related membrane protein [Escherichia coli]